jgi:hypothetical protein
MSAEQAARPQMGFDLFSAQLFFCPTLQSPCGGSGIVMRRRMV